MQIRIALQVLVLLLVSCKTEPENRPESTGQITIIFNQAQNNTRKVYSNGAIRAVRKPGEEITYVDDNGLLIPIKIKYAPKDDTVVIITTRDIVEVDFRHRVMDELNFFFAVGDTVLVTYQGNLPIPTVINRKSNEFDYSNEVYVRNKLHNQDFSSYVKYHYPDDFEFSWYDGISQHEYDNRVKKVRSGFYKKAQQEIQKEDALLDSILISESGISGKFYKLYKLRNRYRLEYLIAKETPNYQRPTWAKNDSLKHFSFYWEYLLQSIQPELLPAKDPETNRLTPTKVIDIILATPNFSNTEKEILLTHYIQDVIQYGSQAEIQKYHTIYEDKITNPDLKSFISLKYNLDFNDSKELRLQWFNKQNLTFSKLLQNQKGKLVYVDFWAGWCAPCRAAMPDSKLLSKEYEGRVTILYLSKDEDFAFWEKACTKLDLRTDRSFFINNQFTSIMIDTLGIKDIPRYLLFDGNGKLVNTNAPGPRGREIRDLFNRQLKNL